MNTWINWASLAREIDPVYAYHYDPNAYPPGTVSILYLALTVTGSMDAALSIKLLLAAFSILTSAALGIWLRSWIIAYVALTFFWLSSVMLSHLDVLYVLPLVVALWALSRDHWMLASFFFATATLIKWQPLIILPFILIFLAHEIAHKSGWGDRVRLLITSIVPGAAVYLITFGVFGFDYILSSINGATLQNMLSGNSLNLGWIFTLFVTDSPNDMVASGYTYISETPPWMPVLLRYLFVGLFVFFMVIFAIMKKSFITMLVFSLFGVLAYVAFAAGVHQNHLTLAVPIALILAVLARPLAYSSALVVVMAAFNLAVFYGFGGQALAPVPQPFNIDLTVWLAGIYVVAALFVFMIGLLFLWENDRFSRLTGNQDLSPEVSTHKEASDSCAD
ncbi:MAG TPA: hypothetical protein DCE52_18985 [Rhodobacteraceae bacterium]|nr:hypothetical protein [Paracoccaceae bacterium]